MIKFLKKLDFWFDWYIAPMMYNERRFYRYVNYMKKKYGDDIVNK